MIRNGESGRSGLQIFTCTLLVLLATCREDRGNVTGSPSVTSSLAPVTLVGAGDIADCSDPDDEATAALLDDIPGTVFTAGDNAYPDGSTTDYANCYGPSWGRHLSRTRPSPGNHDYHVPGAADYFAYFGANAGPAGQGYYSYDIGDWHVISLSSNIARIATSPQVIWLRADLAASTKQCTIAYWHHARFSSGIQHGSNTSMQPIWQALYEAGAEIVISGHEHNYERFAPQTPSGVADPVTGIREFVVGTGGGSHYETFAPIANSEVRDGTTSGVLKLTLDAGTYAWRFIPVAGQTFTDAGSGACHGTPGGRVSPSQSTITASPATIVAGGAPSVITVTAKDPLGNPISGAIVQLAATGSGNILTQPAATTDASGAATGSLGSSAPETKMVTATINDTAITQTVTVTVVPPGSGQTISHLLLTDGNNAVNQKVYTTGFISPAPNTLVTVAVLNHRSYGAVTPTLTGGGMATWTQVASIDVDPISAPRRRLSVFRAMSSAPGSGQITITFTGNVSNCQWIVSQWDGVETSGVNGSDAIVQTGSSRSDAATSLGVSLNAFENPTNAAYGVVGVSGKGPAVTPGTGFVEIAEQPSGESSALEAEWATDDNTIDAGWAKAFKAAMLGLEIRAAASGGGPAVSASHSTVTAVSPIVAGGSSAIIVTARDGSGNPVSGATVVLAATGTGNTLTQPVGTTALDGTITGSLSSTLAETKTISATINGVAINAQPTVTVDPGPAAALVYTTQPSNTDANAPIAPPVVVDVRDAFNNHVNSSASVTMDFGTNAGPGTLSGTLTQGAVNGVATFADLAVTTIATGYTLKASATGLPDAISNAFNITPPAPSASLSMVVAGTPNVTAGGNSDIMVTVKDGLGNAMSGVTVTLSSSVGGDVVTNPPGVSDGSGIATGNVAVTSAGPRTITATAGGIPLTQAPVLTVNGGTANAGLSTVSLNPTTITAGSGSGSATVTVTVRDQYGNPVGGATVVLGATGTGNTVGQPGVTAGNGVTTGTIASTDPQTENVTATADGVPITQQPALTVSNTPPPSSIAHTLLTAGNDPLNAGTYQTAAITPAANALVTLAVNAHRSSAATTASPTVTGGGMAAWTEVATITYSTAALPLQRMTIFRAMSASPGSGPITIVFPQTESEASWIVSQWTGVNTSGSNGSGAIGQVLIPGAVDGVTSVSATLGPLSSPNNVAYAAIGTSGRTLGITPGAGFTEIAEQLASVSPHGMIEALFGENQTVPSASWSGALSAAILTIELKARTEP